MLGVVKHHNNNVNNKKNHIDKNTTKNESNSSIRMTNMDSVFIHNAIRITTMLMSILLTTMQIELELIA